MKEKKVSNDIHNNYTEDLKSNFDTTVCGLMTVERPSKTLAGMIEMSSAQCPLYHV